MKERILYYGAKKKRRSLGLPTAWNRHGYIGDSWKVWGSRLINLKGKTFWNLFVLKRDRTKSSRAYAYWICECECGRRYSIRSDRLRYGLITCCIVCSQRVRLFYKKLRDEKRSEEQIKRAMENRTRFIREHGPILPSLKANTNMYSRDNIPQMRREFGFSIKEIASTIGITEQEVRSILTGIIPIEKKEVKVDRLASYKYNLRSKFKVSEKIGNGPSPKELRQKLNQNTES